MGFLLIRTLRILKQSCTWEKWYVPTGWGWSSRLRVVVLWMKRILWWEVQNPRYSGVSLPGLCGNFAAANMCTIQVSLLGLTNLPYGQPIAKRYFCHTQTCQTRVCNATWLNRFHSDPSELRHCTTDPTGEITWDVTPKGTKCTAYLRIKNGIWHHWIIPMLTAPRWIIIGRQYLSCGVNPLMLPV